jgi:hypothetical protein
MLALCLFSNVHAGQANFPYRGIAYISFWYNEYQDPQSQQSLNDLASTGANSSSLLATWYMNTSTDTSIAPDAMKTPTDTAVIQAISDMHARGLKVMLKPHVDVFDSTFRGNIAPTDPSAWFASYATFINHYAAIAQSQGVELFCVGCELRSLSGAAHKADWQSIISGIRAIYSGPLTYASLAVVAGDEYASVSFWPLLDLAGLDVYTPLTNHIDPSIPELVAAWHNDAFGQDMVTTLRNWQAALGQPAIFTEMGYESASGTNITPYYVNPATASTDQQEQADCFEAAFEVWTQEPWLKGIFWWGWDVPLPLPGDKDYSERGKLAQSILTEWYSVVNTPPSISSPPTVTPNPAQTGESVTFTVAAGDSDGDFLTYSWDFGDSTTGTGSSVAHAYTAAGTYTAIITVSDGFGGSANGQVSIVVGDRPTAPQKQHRTLPPFSVSRLKVKLDFQKLGNDSLKLNGIVQLSTPVPTGGSLVIVNAFGVIRVFHVDGTGTGTLGSNTLKIGKPRPRGTPFSIQLSNENLATMLAAAGLDGQTDVKNKIEMLPFNLYINGTTFESIERISYSAIKDISGSGTLRK